MFTAEPPGWPNIGVFDSPNAEPAGRLSAQEPDWAEFSVWRFGVPVIPQLRILHSAGCGDDLPEFETRLIADFQGCGVHGNSPSWVGLIEFRRQRLPAPPPRLPSEAASRAGNPLPVVRERLPRKWRVCPLAGLSASARDRRRDRRGFPA